MKWIPPLPVKTHLFHCYQDSPRDLSRVAPFCQDLSRMARFYQDLCRMTRLYQDSPRDLSLMARFYQDYRRDLSLRALCCRNLHCHRSSLFTTRWPVSLIICPRVYECHLDFGLTTGALAYKITMTKLCVILSNSGGLSDMKTRPNMVAAKRSLVACQISFVG